MSFKFNWTQFDDSFYDRARTLLTEALNKGNLPDSIAGRIEVKELDLGTKPPELEILEVGDLAEDRFRGVFQLSYDGNAMLALQTKVQVNPMKIKRHELSFQPRNGILAADQPLVVPMLLRISAVRLRAVAVLVVSKRRGVTLVFKNDPLESVHVSSTFDDVPQVQAFLQREIEAQLRVVVREDLPSIIHDLSLHHIKQQPPPSPPLPPVHDIHLARTQSHIDVTSYPPFSPSDALLSPAMAISYPCSPSPRPRFSPSHPSDTTNALNIRLAPGDTLPVSQTEIDSGEALHRVPSDHSCSTLVSPSGDSDYSFLEVAGAEYHPLPPLPSTNPESALQAPTAGVPGNAQPGKTGTPTSQGRPASILESVLSEVGPMRLKFDSATNAGALKSLSSPVSHPVQLPRATASPCAPLEKFPDPSSVDSIASSTNTPIRDPIGLQSPRTLRALATAYSKRPWAVGLGGVGVEPSSYLGAAFAAVSTTALGPRLAPVQPCSAQPNHTKAKPEPSNKAPRTIEAIATPTSLASPVSPVRRRRSASNFSGPASASTQSSQPSLAQLLSLSYQRVDRSGAPQFGSLASVLSPTLNPNPSTAIDEIIHLLSSSSRPRPATMYATTSNIATSNHAESSVAAPSEEPLTAARQVPSNRSVPRYREPASSATINGSHPVQHAPSAASLLAYSTEMPPPPVPFCTTGATNRLVDSKVYPPSAAPSPATSGYPTPLLSRQSSHEPPLMSPTSSSPERHGVSSCRQHAVRNWQSQSHPVTRSSSPTRRYRRAPSSHGSATTTVNCDNICNMNSRANATGSPMLTHAPGCPFAHALPCANQPIVLQPSTNATAAHLADLMHAGCTLSPYMPAIERFTHCAMPTTGSCEKADPAGHGPGANSRRDGSQRSHPAPPAIPHRHSYHHHSLEPVPDQLAGNPLGSFSTVDGLVIADSTTANGRSHSFTGLSEVTAAPTDHNTVRSISEPPATILPVTSSPPVRCWCTAVRYSNATSFAAQGHSDSTHPTAALVPATHQLPLETVSMPATPLPELSRSQSWTSRRTTRKQGVRAKIKRSVYRLQGVSFTF